MIQKKVIMSQNLHSSSFADAFYKILCIFSLFGVLQSLSAHTFSDGDILVNMTGRYRPESFFGKNVSLLNNCNRFDKLFWARHTFDMGCLVSYGHKTYGKEVLTFKVDWRNKARWGDPTSIASTTQTETRSLDEIGRSHSHAFPRLISWLREIWLEYDIAQALGLTFSTKPIFKLGAFPFEVGRGIALGSAYAVGPEFLGFYNDGAIDQFAFGAKISDVFLQDTVAFDFYVGLLQNRAGSLGQTGALLLTQEYGRRDCPERGPYKINFVTASRVKWTVFDTPKMGKFIVEPYAVFNHDPEQRVEFSADSESKLFTLGCAAEYVGDRYELGFDYAVNMGRQRVKGWDRNINQLENRNGRPVVVNSHVYANINPEDVTQVIINKNDPTKFKAVNAKNTVSAAPASAACVESDALVQSYGKTAQALIESSVQDAQFNGAALGQVENYSDAVVAPMPNNGSSCPDITYKDILFNAPDRYRNEYTNAYAGWMFVGDAAVWLIEKKLRLAITGGVTSGDANPNEINMDGTYSGFIPLQEIYSGKRVQSVFLLGSGGQLNRPLSQPRNNRQEPSGFASAVNGFTNLVLVGGGALWKPETGSRKVSINPNILAFWQQFPGFKFDAMKGKDTDEMASSYLGLELNIFFDYMMFENTKLFIVSSLFVPGKHFSDIKGRPITSSQEQRLNRFNRTSITGAPIPNIGDDYAFTFNIGMEVKF